MFLLFQVCQPWHDATLDTEPRHLYEKLQLVKQRFYSYMYKNFRNLPKLEKQSQPKVRNTGK